MRRNKPRVVWLPPSPAGLIGQNPSPSNFKEFFVDIVGPIALGDFAIGELPLVLDDVNTSNPAVNTLSDIESSGYRLRRVVGKIWLEFLGIDFDPGIPGTEQPNSVAVTAGLIVRRVDPVTGTSLSATNAAGASLTSPTQAENITDPWIWRRSWIFVNNKQLAADQAQGLMRNDVFGSGGVADGPHIDQKTARIVGPEERLFLDVGVLALDAAPLAVGPTSVRVITDLRILGSMRVSAGNRRNASR